MVHTAFAIPENTGDDVGENPGPTTFDIIDLATTVSTDSSQGNEAIFGVNAAIIYQQIQDNSTLNNSTLITLL